MTEIKFYAPVKEMNGELLSAMTAEERAHIMTLRAELEDYRTRFYAQFKGTPDPIAPKDKDGNYLIYARLDNFIRAVISKERPFG